MTDQPPVQPPPKNPGANPETQPMASTTSASAGTPPAAGGTNVWRRATSTNRGRWALGIGAGALAALMLLVVGVAGIAALRHQDRISLLGQRQDGYHRGQDGPGDGMGGLGDRGRDWENRDRPRMPGMPGMRDGRAQDAGGLGNILGSAALHGSVTANVNGLVQALVFQRGEVTAVSATSITLKSSDGFAGTYRRTAETISRRAVPVKGGQAFVVARTSDKVALTTTVIPG